MSYLGSAVIVMVGNADRVDGAGLEYLVVGLGDPERSKNDSWIPMSLRCSIDTSS